MKKFLLLLAFPTLLSVTSQAQDDSESRKPEAGDVTTEVSLGLFSSGITLNNVVNQLKARYFLAPDLAARLGFNATSNSQRTEALPNTSDFSYEFKNSSFTISPGIEKHFAGTDRLSPYIGAELAFTSYNVSELRERESGTPKEIEFVNSRTNGGSGGLTDRGYNRFGVNALAGVDYYFARHFYAGIELGYGFAVRKEKEAERLTDGKSDFKMEGTKSSSLGAYANNGIRIGFVF